LIIVMCAYSWQKFYNNIQQKSTTNGFKNMAKR